MSFPLDKPLYRYAIETPKHPWRNYKRRSGYGAKHSERMILALAKIEQEVRTEIAQDTSQVWLLPNGLMAQRLKGKKKLPPLMG